MFAGDGKKRRLLFVCEFKFYVIIQKLCKGKGEYRRVVDGPLPKVAKSPHFKFVKNANLKFLQKCFTLKIPGATPLFLSWGYLSVTTFLLIFILTNIASFSIYFLN